MSGRITKERYKYATIYVDTYSGYSYVNLQKTLSASETVEGKIAFEALCEQHGVKVRGYHADNGIFRAKEWINDCKAKNQGLTFTGVNAHHSNGRAERRIRLLQNLSRSMLIYADRRWGGGAIVHPWPYAMRMANASVNNSPNMQDKFKRSPTDIMFNTYVQMNVKHWYPFACPVYVLDSKLQDEKRIYHKWESRSRVGIYLGHSPLHARNIALVLNMETGLVSPQFHVRFEKTFETIRENPPHHRWLATAGFRSDKRSAVMPTSRGDFVPKSTEGW